MPQKNRTAKGVLGGLFGLVALSTVAGVLVTATVTPAIAVSGAAAKQAIDLFEDLPAYLHVDAPMEPWNIYVPTGEDGKYKKLATFFDQNREPLTFDQLPPVVIDAVLSSEDKLFYEHSGVNIGATAKALWDNIRQTSSRGASTISQQFVKNVQIQMCEQDLDPGTEGYQAELEACWLEFSQAQGNEGMQRKLQEMRYALQIEKDYSKNDILLGYLNVASFGGQAYGIEAAAKRYFGKSTKDLSIAEAATLAGIVQEPSTFRIDVDRDDNNAENGFQRTLDRRNYVIRQMYLNGKITQEQYEEARATPIEPNITPPPSGCSGADGYFCLYVKAAVEAHPALGETAEERKATLRRGGIDVYTTLDPSVQEAGVNVMEDSVPTYVDGMLFGAASVTLEADTGRVLAMVQNTTFDERPTADKTIGETALVYAADRAHGGSQGFPVGSAYKLFTLIDWLENGRSINEVLNGRRQVFRNYTCNGEPQTNNDLIQNFNDGGGSVSTVTRFTAQSLNTGFLAMAAQLDVCEINEVAARMGVKHATGEPITTFKSGNQVIENYGTLYEILGSKSIAPIDMAAAYATVANKGRYCEPHAIDRMVGRDGEDIPLPDVECRQVIEESVAATAAHALRSVMSATGSGSNTGDGVPLIGKTGTHQRFQTTMVASSTETTTATWVGNVEGESSLYNKSYRNNGLDSLRHVITRNIQRAANAEYGGGSWPSPDSHLTRVVYADLPNVVGKTVEEATRELTALGFQVTVGSEVDSELARGLVAEQSPGAGRAPGGSTITLSPSNGEATTIPHVQGMAPQQALDQLRSHGYVNSSLGRCTADEDMHENSPGVVTGTSPGGGEVANRRTQVRVDYRAPSCT